MPVQHSSGSCSQLKKLLQRQACEPDNQLALQPVVEQQISCEPSAVGGQHSPSAQVVCVKCLQMVVVALPCCRFPLS